mmetsp:Transcript_71329/g.157780  ORF Transcript_71329/g.157780 Transcript_71329/m.157780 type:complete len:260 (-) Transcript_71329:338-1117(-)
MKALPTLLLAEHEDLRWNHSATLINGLEAAQEPGKGPAALHAVLHCLEGAEVTVPRKTARGCWPMEVRIVLQLLRKLAIPAVDRSGTVASRITHVSVPRIGLCRAVPPHVRHLGMGRHGNLAAAKPHAQGLVDVFSAPAEHLLVVAACLLPPPPGHAKEAPRDQRNVHVIGVDPFEVCIPSEIALRHAAIAHLRPGVYVQRCDGRYDHASVVLTDELYEIHVPIALWGHVTIEEADDVALGSIAAGLLGTDKADGRLVP